MNALSLFLALAFPAAASGPIDVEMARLAAQGFRPSGGATARTRKGEVWAAMLRREDGTQRLYLYIHDSRKVKTLHMELGGSQKLELDSIHDGGDLPDLEGDGGRIVALRTIMPGLDQETLVVLRVINGGVEKLGRVSGGRFKDIDGDGRLEIVGRERPLGALFSMSCRSFHTMAQAAWRTTVHILERGKLVKASERFTPFYDKRIAAERRELSGIDARATDDYGGFLGLTLSLYFDYEQSGRSRQGWGEFRRLFPVKDSDPAPVKRCMQQMEGVIKDKLDIPADW
ncbi:MAG: hypothetical protein HYZ75_18325 [Elusimicrobia bacterium]|nr:hypothetical protein [Elusimicrobiota bacterium]